MKPTPLDEITRTRDSHITTSNEPFIVASRSMVDFMSMVERMARHPASVLITGETGTGKERIAHSIHENSTRAHGPFIDINCAALPEHLVESELFGHEKGAFSGADTGRAGLFEVAHGGTIFLDEIGELDLKVQVKLLRVLDRAPYYRLGGHRKILPDARVVAATNRDLRDEVSAGRFRKDLYHRLCQFELSVPPLRSRPDDVAAIAEYLLAQAGSGLQLSDCALEELRTYPWPGNVRELQNLMNKVIFSANGRVIYGSNIRVYFLDTMRATEHKVEDSFLETCADQHLAQAIQRALEKTGGHRGQAAVELGISRRTLSRKLREFGVTPIRQGHSTKTSADNEEDRQSFRTELRVPALLITAEGRELECYTTNVSASGMGLEGLTTVLHHRSGLQIQFQLPNSPIPLETDVRLAWCDKQGGLGLTFANMSAANQRDLSMWLRERMQSEGWLPSPLNPEMAEEYPRTQ